MFVVWRGDLLLSLLMKQFLKSVNIWRSYMQEGCFTRCVHLGTVLHKDKEFAIDFTYSVKKLLLSVVTLLVSPLILTLVVTNIINLIRPILTS